MRVGASAGGGIRFTFGGIEAGGLTCFVFLACVLSNAGSVELAKIWIAFGLVKLLLGIGAGRIGVGSLNNSGDVTAGVGTKGCAFGAGLAISTLKDSIGVRRSFHGTSRLGKSRPGIPNCKDKINA